jgi:hypothetical protein
MRRENAARKKRNVDVVRYNKANPHALQFMEEMLEYRERDVNLSAVTDARTDQEWLLSWFYSPKPTMQLMREGLWRYTVEVDATHGRHPDYMGTFYFITIKLSEHKVLLLGAMWHYEGEKGATWDYFIEQIVAAAPCLTDEQCVFVIDLDRALWNAVAKYAPQAKRFADKKHRINNILIRMSANGARIGTKMVYAKTRQRVENLMRRLEGSRDGDYLTSRFSNSEQFVACSSIRDGHDNSNGVESLNKAMLVNGARESNPAHALRVVLWWYHNKLQKLSNAVMSARYQSRVDNGLPTLWFKKNIEGPALRESLRMHVTVDASRMTGLVRDQANPNFNSTVTILAENDPLFDPAMLNICCTCDDAVLHRRCIPCKHMFAFCAKANININYELHEMHRAEYAQLQIKSMPAFEYEDPKPRKRYDGALKLPREAQNRRGAPKKHKRKKSALERIQEKRKKTTNRSAAGSSSSSSSSSSSNSSSSSSSSSSGH